MNSTEQVCRDQMRVLAMTIEGMKDDSLAPMIVLHTTDDSIVPALLPYMPPSGDDRRAMFDWLGGKVAETMPEIEVQYLTVIAEAWTAKATPEEIEKGEPAVRPSKNPNKEEVVIVTTIAADNTNVIAILKTHRDSENNMHVHPEEAQVLVNEADSYMTEGFFPAYHQARRNLLNDEQVS